MIYVDAKRLEIIQRLLWRLINDTAPYQFHPKLTDILRKQMYAHTIYAIQSNIRNKACMFTKAAFVW